MRTKFLQDNIRRVAEERESFLGYYYRNEDGDLVLVNLYDIQDTEPSEILGRDIIGEDEEDEQDFVPGATGGGPVDPSDVENRLKEFRGMEEEDDDMCRILINEKCNIQYRTFTYFRPKYTVAGLSSDPESDWDHSPNNNNGGGEPAVRVPIFHQQQHGSHHHGQDQQ